jgi:UDP-glucose 4-epimerase
VKVLITGVAGGIAQKLAMELVTHGHQVVGVDVRAWNECPSVIEMHRTDLRKRAAEDVFRKCRPQAVVHMATVSQLVASSNERSRINLGGTQAVFEHCRNYGVEHCIFVGRHTYYGAAADTPLYHAETEPPQALGEFPELADLVAADLFATSQLWQKPELTTSVLRICYTLGPIGQGTLATFLKARLIPMVMGFDPLFQFLHEDDVIAALMLTLTARPRGIYNVAGPMPLPLSVLAKETHRPVLPMPEFLLRGMLGRAGLPNLPVGALNHIKFPVVVDGAAFQKTCGFKHQFDELQTVRSFAQAWPAPHW